MGLRRTFQTRIDRLQYWYDTFPRLPYQPLPWIGRPKADRGTGTLERWKAIEASLDPLDIHTALDIGSNVGFFAFSLAERGILTMAVEMDRRLLRIAQYACERISVDPPALCQLAVNKKTISLLPNVDLVVVLSVWHHWVKYFGLEDATEIMTGLWQHTQRVLFFETGEREMSPDFNLPAFEPTPVDWIGDYLRGVCTGGQVQHLGLFKAFRPGGNESKGVVSRNMFRVVRL